MNVCECYFISFAFFVLIQGTQQLPQYETLFKEIDTCECGRASDEVAPRIVGGEVVEANNYPWMAAIFLNGKMHCGGSLINDRYVITAGHCLNRLNKNDLQVVLGVLDLHKLPEDKRRSGTDNEIESTMIHEEFASDYLHDMEDVGLIKLKNPVQFSSRINPICMPKKDMVFETKRALVTGWGRTDQDGSPSKALRKANLRVMKNEECRNITSVGEHITDSMICAYEPQTDACQGDSGGPLVFDNNGKMELVGIVSWGIGCAKPGIPGVYSRMTSYLDWLSRHTRDAVYCKNK